MRRKPSSTKLVICCNGVVLLSFPPQTQLMNKITYPACTYRFLFTIEVSRNWNGHEKEKQHSQWGTIFIWLVLDGMVLGLVSRLDTGEDILWTVLDRGFHTRQKLLKDDFYHRSSGQKWGFNRLTDCGQLPSQVLAVENNDSIVFSKTLFPQHGFRYNRLLVLSNFLKAVISEEQQEPTVYGHFLISK